MHFALPLSLEAHEELHILDEHVNNIQREGLQLDEWSYAWGAKDFRAHKYYRYTTLFMPLPASVPGLMCSSLGDTTYSMYQDVVATLRRSTNLEGDKVLNIPSGMTLTSHSAIFAKIIHTVFELA